MISTDDLRQLFERPIRAFAESRAFQDLIEGRLAQSEVRAFIGHLFRPHYQSAHIIAFSYALLASEASELLKGNLLEEMGQEEGEEAHPDLLVKLASGAGFSSEEIAGLVAQSREDARRFCAQPLPFSTLRDMGLAILLESSSFEHFLSRYSESIGGALRDRYGFPDDALTWFMLHGELDIRHAEEALTVLHEYVAFHQIADAQVGRIAQAVFATNPYGKRYFPAQDWHSGNAIASVKAPHPAAANDIVALSVYHLDIPFRESFRHSQADRAASDAIVVRVRDADGRVGYGECLPRDYVTGETSGSVLSYIRDHLASWVLTTPFWPGSATWEALAAFGRQNVYGRRGADGHSNNAAFCALELALLDWSYRLLGQSVNTRLAPLRREVAYSGVVSAEDATIAAALARRFVDAGIEHIKLKVGVGDDVGRLKAVREAVGEAVGLRADANGARGMDEAIARLRELAPFGLECVEEPIVWGAEFATRLLQVRQQSGVAIVVDESLVTIDDAETLATVGACDIFNVRLSKNGGLTGAIALCEIGRRAGVRIQVGAQVGETAILTAAGRHLAASIGELAYAEGSFGTLLLTEDIAAQEMRFGFGGLAPVLTGPGLGIEVQQDALERLSIETLEID